ncbi:MAG: hypothetical protein ACK5PW_16245 [Burkholderiales bacterium]
MQERRIGAVMLAVCLGMVVGACGGGGGSEPSPAPTQVLLSSSKDDLRLYAGVWKSACTKVLNPGAGSIYRHAIESYRFGTPAGNRISIEFTQQTYSDALCAGSSASPSPVMYSDEYVYSGQLEVFTTPEVSGVSDKFVLANGTIAITKYFAFQQEGRVLRFSAGSVPGGQQAIFSSLDLLYAKQ